MPPARAHRIGPRDLLLAAIVLVLDLTMFSYVGAASGPARAEVVVPYAALACAALLWRRRAPVLVFAVAWVHATVAVLIPQMAYLPTIPMLAAMYALTLYRGTAAGWLSLPAYLVPAGFAVADAVGRASIEETWRNALIVAVMELSLGVGAVAFGRAALTVGRVEAEAAVNAERMRIARELHDIVAHSVTVIVLQAAGAQRLLDTQPEQSRRALTQISEVGKQAMDELRRLLRLLRTPDEPAPSQGGPPAAAPQPGLAQTAALVASIRAAGTPVTLREAGEPAILEPGVDLAAYRIVQEALTNITKHTPHGTAATVDLAWTDRELALRIANPAPARGRPATVGLACGYGLLGIRERATLAGGDLSAGHTPEGGFEVRATLPVTIPAGTGGKRP